MINDPLTYKIIGCAMKVHNTLGPGFQEVIYQRCLAIEFERAGLLFEREKEQTVFYDGIAVGTRRSDFIVEKKVMVELKARSIFRMLIWHRQKTMLLHTISQ
jgi:GxxExxY protein